MKRFTLTAASLLLGLTTAMAQDTKVTGHVVDENGDPVIGATILVKGLRGNGDCTSRCFFECYG